MKIIPRIELKLEGYEKCNLICDNDCPLGTLFDYSCAFSKFVLERMQESQKDKEETEEQKAA